MVFLLQNIVIGIMVGCVYSMVALGYILVFKACRIFNFAQASFMLLGAYVAWFFNVTLGFPIGLSLIATVVVGALLSVGLERFPMRPMIGQSDLAIVLMTLALMAILGKIVTLFWGGMIKTYDSSLSIINIPVGGMMFSLAGLLSCLFTLVVFLGLSIFFRRSRIGLLMRGVAEDQVLAQSTGINVNKIIAYSWVIASTIAMCAGVLMGSIGSVSLVIQEIGFVSIIVAIFGGMESIEGAFISGAMLGVAEVLVRVYVGHGLFTVIPYIILLLIMIFRPYGLFGLERVERI
jgi:branched-chain amino acid transport system permease protein